MDETIQQPTITMGIQTLIDQHEALLKLLKENQRLTAICNAQGQALAECQAHMKECANGINQEAEPVREASQGQVPEVRQVDQDANGL